MPLIGTLGDLKRFQYNDFTLAIKARELIEKAKKNGDKLEDADQAIYRSRSADQRSQDMFARPIVTDGPMPMQERFSPQDHLRAGEMHRVAADGMNKLGNAPLVAHHSRMAKRHMMRAQEMDTLMSEKAKRKRRVKDENMDDPDVDDMDGMMKKYIAPGTGNLGFGGSRARVRRRSRPRRWLGHQGWHIHVLNPSPSMPSGRMRHKHVLGAGSHPWESGKRRR